ncbi:probable E3 ubiquitin-protein ligase TRIML1 [Trichosurus vulpecula]|uniref:probable E3 ubiquitin-protein ligase TRIML1 n=1 Tax=Trichosurus vulpecula TaxID=9337 RepID=UPI00186B3E2C|nr:probable E3 ubiquitin-protein ligase TRIML1 [Trichosurus vulpecula]
MDARDLIENLKAELTCSICLGCITDPVTVKCGHSFCTGCLLQCKEEDDETFTCPECRGVIRHSDLVPNKQLQNLSITGKRLRSHLLQSMVGLTTCDQHGEKEKFFCEEDQRLLCDSCLLAPEHKNHHVLPLETATDKCKDKLQETRNILEKKELEFKTALEKVRRRKTRCKEDTYDLKQSVISEYGKMHQFLWDEEHEYLKRLDQESRDNLVKLEERKAELSQQIQNLQRMIVEIQENLDKAPLEVLQDMTGTLEKNEECLLQKPELPSLGWSTYSITALREMLMSFQRDITFDPESANPHLTLSEDLKKVKYGSVPQDLPNNKERFDYVLAVLGAQTFTSGKHYWEVEVGDKTEWELGICKDSVSRKGQLSSSSENVRILAGCTSGNCYFILNSHNDFQSIQPIHKVGIFLDYEKGHIAFYNVTDRCLIYSPSNIVFEGLLRPYFSFGVPKEESTSGSLIICPIIND